MRLVAWLFSGSPLGKNWYLLKKKESSLINRKGPIECTNPLETWRLAVPLILGSMSDYCFRSVSAEGFYSVQGVSSAWLGGSWNEVQDGRESPWGLFCAPAAMMHVWYAGAALAIVLHTGDLKAAYYGKGWKKKNLNFCSAGEPVRKQCRQHSSSSFL